MSLVTMRHLFTGLIAISGMFLGAVTYVDTAAAATPRECLNLGTADAIERCAVNVRERCESLGTADAVNQCIIDAERPAPEQAGNCSPGYVETSFAFGGEKCIPENSESAELNNNPIFVLFTEFLTFLSALVGVAVAGGIIWGGILYSTAQGNPGQSQKAMTVIFNSILGLIMYILMFAIINFLVPGGLFA